MPGKPETVTVPHLGGSTISYKFGQPYNPSLPTLVMINSFTTSMELYRAQFADSELIAADECAGHRALRARRHTRDIGTIHLLGQRHRDLQVLEVLGIPEVFVLGTSQGGWIAARMAMLAPDKVKGIIVLGTSMDDESQRSRDLGCWDGDEFCTPTIDELADPVGDDWVVSDDYVTGLLESGLGDTVTPDEHDFWLTTYRANYTGDAGRKRLLISRDQPARPRRSARPPAQRDLPGPVAARHRGFGVLDRQCRATRSRCSPTRPAADLRVVEGRPTLPECVEPARRRSGNRRVRQPVELEANADARCTAAERRADNHTRHPEVTMYSESECTHARVVRCRYQQEPRPSSDPDRKEPRACRTHNRSSQYATPISS